MSSKKPKSDQPKRVGAPRNVGAPRKSAANKKTNAVSIHLEPGQRPRIERAAVVAHLDLGVWARQRLVMVADYALVGISLEVAYKAALDELARNNPAAYQSAISGLGGGPQKKAP